ncbi:MAG: hypothetical protein ACREA0_21560 [bacterium]
MPDSVPGFRAIKETEEIQLTAVGPDNNHGRFHIRGAIQSAVVDAGNTPTTTLRGGNVIARQDADSLDRLYNANANDGLQGPIGILEKHLSMLDRDGSVEEKFTRLLTGGIIKREADILGVDPAVMAVLLRSGFRIADKPHGSAFLLHPVRRDTKTANYTVVVGDNGKLLVANGAGALTFTLPALATAKAGFEVQLFNAVAQNMVVTAEGAVILLGTDAAGVSTTLTFSTLNEKVGASVLLRADYHGANLRWFPMMLQRTATLT